jgi:hypothetical protein
VFDLESLVTEKFSERVFEMSSKIYENRTEDIRIFNKFDQEANFLITLEFPQQAVPLSTNRQPAPTKQNSLNKT